MNEVKVLVKGMNCNHCKITVENGLKRVKGIEQATADIVDGVVTIKGNDFDSTSVKSMIEDLGYTYVKEL
jgi:copper chaperone CopZ